MRAANPKRLLACATWRRHRSTDGRVLVAPSRIRGVMVDGAIPDVILEPGFVTDPELQARVNREVSWHQPVVTLFGRSHPVPRLTCWIGDPGAAYRYSGTTHVPEPWTDDLMRLRRRLERHLGRPFNSVLLNRYRDGRDSMGWHADDEPELGATPVIASISLGATRTLRFRHRQRRFPPLAFELEHGSLLVMAGDTQAQWQHCLPKRARVRGERLNLTFRYIVPSERR